ncbi:putative polygalacturonase [Hordeum vulgare]|nr:putative polygalacturonase [Hordeum vulgare]
MATATALLRLAALAGAVALLLPGAAEARVLLSLDDFGAVRDGIADDTQALVDAWKVACAYSNGYVVIHVPAGKSYQIWPVTLAGPCRDEIMLFVRPFHPSPPPRAFLLSAMHLRVSAHRVFGLCPGAAVQVSGNIIVTESPEDWDRSDGGKWLHFFQVQDLTVSGGDVIDGRGQEWWARRPARGRSTTTTRYCSLVSQSR